MQCFQLLCKAFLSRGENSHSMLPQLAEFTEGQTTHRTVGKDTLPVVGSSKSRKEGNSSQDTRPFH